MTRQNLIKALRVCDSVVDGCEHCPMFTQNGNQICEESPMLLAANMLEKDERELLDEKEAET